MDGFEHSIWTRKTLRSENKSRIDPSGKYLHTEEWMRKKKLRRVEGVEVWTEIKATKHSKALQEHFLLLLLIPPSRLLLLLVFAKDTDGKLSD